ncbi:uncharacterized protein LOC132057690 [Lycium ferocissimum]|uniref:uncharacterized protein LOC132057690 n=1 Tax=Lycium ferocissimum TaxID=112874 RepID=UPI0028155642|nr:uncharacterized protein LOC132057690 [Lycium ferocissimum]
MIDKVLFWNIRLVNTQQSFERLTDLNRRHHYALIALMEPFQSADSIDSYKSRLRYQNAHVNYSGKIWIFWADEWQGLVMSDSEQQVTIKMNLIRSLHHILVSIVYAKCDERDREDLWDALNQMIPDDNIPWLVGGDFNVILSEENKQGGLPVTVQETMDFAQWIQNCGLIDIGFIGSRYTWWNGRTQEACIFKRLDRMLCNQAFLDIKPSSKVHHLIRQGSDHAPLHLICDDVSQSIRKPFKFLKFWTKDHKFMDTVRDNWKADFVGNPFYVYHHKIKKVKQGLVKWSRDTFGDIFQYIATIEDTISVKELQFELAPTPGNREELHKAQAELSKFLYLEEEN